LVVLAGIKTASYLIHGIVMLCHFMNHCTLYLISIGALSFKKSVSKIPFWGIEKLSGTTSILSRYPISETWTELSDSTKSSVTPTICNLFSLKICVSAYTAYTAYKLLTLIRLDFLIGFGARIKHENEFWEYSFDKVIMGKAGNFLRFITATLFLWFHLLCFYHIYQTYPVRARSRSVHWPWEVLRVSQGSIPWIIVLTFATFLDFYIPHIPLILTITALFGIPFIFYYCWFPSMCLS